VVAYRVNEPGADPSLLAALATNPSAQRLSPAPLSHDAVAAVVRAQHPDAEPEFCAAFWKATAGNPFLLREVLATAEERALEPVAAEAGAIAALAPEAVM